MAANASLILIAILATIVFFKQYVFVGKETTQGATTAATSPLNARSSENLIGKHVPVSQKDWSSSRKTLVLYLSTTCHFCRESSPFYRQLVDKAKQDPNVRIVAIFPEGEDSAKDLLKKEGVQIDEVYSGSLESIGVIATPTIMLVNQDGTITDSWLGKLPAEKENDVVKAFLG